MVSVYLKYGLYHHDVILFPLLWRRRVSMYFFWFTSFQEKKLDTRTKRISCGTVVKWIVTSDYFMVVTLKVVHVVQARQPKSCQQWLLLTPRSWQPEGEANWLSLVTVKILTTNQLSKLSILTTLTTCSSQKLSLWHCHHIEKHSCRCDDCDNSDNHKVVIVTRCWQLLQLSVTTMACYSDDHLTTPSMWAF